MKIRIAVLLFLISIKTQASPVSVSDGGTGLVTLTATGGLPYGTSPTDIAILPIGSASQTLTVSNSNLPSWSSNFFPGYTAGTNFAYGGTTSTLANSPTDTIIIATSTPGSILSTATDDTSVGYNTFTALTSASRSVAIGSGALQSLTSGDNNTAFGYQALNKSSTGGRNTAVGYQADFNMTIGAALSSTAVGYQALFTNQVGTTEAAFGVHALYAVLNSTRNTGFGYYAGQAISSGNDNTAFGYQALYTLATTNQNTAIGSNALYNATGSNNVAVGSSAMFTNTSGGNNAAVGYQAMYTNLSGGNNTAVGHLALYSNSTTSQSTAFGALALQTSVTANNTAFGYNALNDVNGAGTQMTALGSGAGSTATTGSNNLYIGYNAAPISNTESNNTVIGNTSTATAYMFGIFGVTSAGASNVVINASGQMGTIISSRQFKTNIVNVSDGTVEKILNFRVVTYTLIGDETKEIHYGLIAEEVDEIMPEIVVRNKNNEIETVQYFKLIPLLVQAVQNKNDTIAALTDNLNGLKERITALLVRYTALN